MNATVGDVTAELSAYELMVLFFKKIISTVVGSENLIVYVIWIILFAYIIALRLRIENLKKEIPPRSRTRDHYE
jgi:hypothetical protein